MVPHQQLGSRSGYTADPSQTRPLIIPRPGFNLKWSIGSNYLWWPRWGERNSTSAAAAFSSSSWSSDSHCHGFSKNNISRNLIQTPNISHFDPPPPLRRLWIWPSYPQLSGTPLFLHFLLSISFFSHSLSLTGLFRRTKKDQERNKGFRRFTFQTTETHFKGGLKEQEQEEKMVAKRPSLLEMEEQWGRTAAARSSSSRGRASAHVQGRTRVGDAEQEWPVQSEAGRRVLDAETERWSGDSVSELERVEFETTGALDLKLFNAHLHGYLIHHHTVSW